MFGASPRVDDALSSHRHAVTAARRDLHDFHPPQLIDVQGDGREHVTLSVSWERADVTYPELPVLGTPPCPDFSSLAQRQRVADAAGDPADLLTFEALQQEGSSAPPASRAIHVGGRQRASFSHAQAAQGCGAPREDPSSLARCHVEVPPTADVGHAVAEERAVKPLDLARRRREGEVELSIDRELRDVCNPQYAVGCAAPRQDFAVIGEGQRVLVRARDLGHDDPSQPRHRHRQEDL
mmetsp:Transcript_28927/g.93246  ORF Transcript_28927/g.93246 Transcript_28927/m.93246 type:complete len:238 (-) Transcript_28927:1139-1852(-)